MIQFIEIYEDFQNSPVLICNDPKIYIRGDGDSEKKTLVKINEEYFDNQLIINIYHDFDVTKSMSLVLTIDINDRRFIGFDNAISYLQSLYDLKSIKNKIDRIYDND